MKWRRLTGTSLPGTRRDASSEISPHSKGPTQRARYTLRILRSAKCYDRPALSASSFPEREGAAFSFPSPGTKVPTSPSDSRSLADCSFGSADRQRANSTDSAREKSSKKREGCESRHANCKVNQLARAREYTCCCEAWTRVFLSSRYFLRVLEEEEKKRRKERTAMHRCLRLAGKSRIIERSRGRAWLISSISVHHHHASLPPSTRNAPEIRPSARGDSHPAISNSPRRIRIESIFE